MYYKGMTGTPEEGHVVEKALAYDYALERCLKGTEDDQREFREMLVEWFYSGNWIEGEEDGEESA